MAEKKNFWGQVIQTINGALSFGGLSEKGDVTSSIDLSAKDGRHFIDLTENGTRKGWTTINAPGAVQISAGEDLKKEQDGIFFNSENGDIIIRARNGKLRIEALDIELVATGSGDEGFVEVRANNSMKFDSNNFTINAKEALNLLTRGLLTLDGKFGLKINAPIVKGDSCATNNDKKPGQIR